MNKKVLIIANHFITLYKFRKELIDELVNSDYEVYISIPTSDDNSYFEERGCTLIDTHIDRRGVNPLTDIYLFIQYMYIFMTVKPDVVLSYTIKPNIYGSIASKILNIKQICNITGTGATFIEVNLLSKIAQVLYRFSVKRAHMVYFQNKGDLEFFLQNDMINNNHKLIPGSGVNLRDFVYTEMTEMSVTKFIFIGRIMKVKGIDEFLVASKRLTDKYKNIEILVAGFIEEEVYTEILREYDSNKIIKYLGYIDNVKEYIVNSHCIVLPSHGGEGVPNVLLESAAIGRACIASRINGSVDVVDNNITGFIFECKNSDDLFLKMEKFHLMDLEAKKKMGIEGHKKVKNHFSRSAIIEIYKNEIRSVWDNKE